VDSSDAYAFLMVAPVLFHVAKVVVCMHTANTCMVDKSTSFTDLFQIPSAEYQQRTPVTGKSTPFTFIRRTHFFTLYGKDYLCGKQ